MIRVVRGPRRRLVGAVATVGALLVGLVTAVSVLGGAPKAGANPNGSVYVVGGEIPDGGTPNGTVDAFALSSVRTDPAQVAKTQHGTTNAIPVIATTITPDGSKVVLLEDDFSQQWAVQYLTVSNGSVSKQSALVSGDPVAVAADPANSEVAFVVGASGQVSRVDLASNPPTVSTVGTATVPGATIVANTIAISPDGSTAYVGGNFTSAATGAAATSAAAVGASDPDVIVAMRSLLSTGVVAATWVGGSDGAGGESIAGSFRQVSGVADLAVAPDGSALYAVDVGDVFGIRLTGGLPPATGTSFGPNGLQGGLAGTALAMNPDGSTVYVAGIAGKAAGVEDLSTSAGSPGPLSSLPTSGPVPRDAAVSLAVSPDDQTLLATVGGAQFTRVALFYPVGLGPGLSIIPPGQPITLTDSTGTTGSDPSLGPTPGPQAIAVFQPGVPPPPVTTTTTLPGSTTTAPPSSSPTTTLPAPNGTTTTLPGQPNTTTTTPAPGHHVPGTPFLTLDPTIGPPGTIVTVTGSGFTPHVPVTVSWSVSTGSVVIVADGHGNLPPTDLNILTPDVLGPRLAEASSTPRSTAQFLVVPSDSEPGGDDAGFLFRSEGP